MTPNGSKESAFFVRVGVVVVLISQMGEFFEAVVACAVSLPWSLESVPDVRWHFPAWSIQLIDLVDFFVQVRHTVIDPFEPVEKPPLHMADGQQDAIDILLARGFELFVDLCSFLREPCV